VKKIENSAKKKINKVFDKFGIDRRRPIVTQISRFDYLKDPVGVIEAYKLAKNVLIASLFWQEALQRTTQKEKRYFQK